MLTPEIRNCKDGKERKSQEADVTDELRFVAKISESVGSLSSQL